MLLRWCTMIQCFSIPAMMKTMQQALQCTTIYCIHQLILSTGLITVLLHHLKISVGHHPTAPGLHSVFIEMENFITIVPFRVKVSAYLLQIVLTDLSKIRLENRCFFIAGMILIP